MQTRLSWQLPLTQEIDVYNLSNETSWGTLRGHTGEVDSVQFSPVRPLELVSAASHETSRRKRTVLSQTSKPEIVVWDLSQAPTASGESDAQIAFDVAANEDLCHALAVLASKGMTLQPSEVEAKDVKASLEATLLEMRTLRSLPADDRIFGRFLPRFQSPVFSQNGNLMLYLPGDRPNSNGDDKWDMISLRERPSSRLKGTETPSCGPASVQTRKS